MSYRTYIRPSSLGPIEICPARPRMEARALALVPALAKIEHAAATQGTLGHEAVAHALTLIYHTPGGERSPEAAESVLPAFLHGLEPWTKDGARRCLAYAVSLVERERAMGQTVTVYIEYKLSGAGIEIDRGGTADLIIVSVGRHGRRVIVADWKLGFLDQGEAADHMQLGGYAVMAWDKFSPDVVEIHLAQGRLRDFSSALYRRQSIESTRIRVINIVRTAHDEAAPIITGIDACRYCKAITHCRPLRERIMDAKSEMALFGADYANRVRMAEDAALAKRFAAEVGELQKVWRAENAGAYNKPASQE